MAIAMTTFELSPWPNQATNSDANTIFGTAWKPTTQGWMQHCAHMMVNPGIADAHFCYLPGDADASLAVLARRVMRSPFGSHDHARLPGLVRDATGNVRRVAAGPVPPYQAGRPALRPPGRISPWVMGTTTGSIRSRT